MLSNSYLYHINVVSDGSKLWFIAQPYSFLMEVDIVSSSMRCLGIIPESEQEMSYRGLFYHESKLYLLPFYGKNIWEYDLKNGNIKKIGLNSKISYLFTSATYHSGNIYMHGRSSVIVKYGLTDCKVTYLRIPETLCSEDSLIQLWWGGCDVDNKIVLSSIVSNILIEVDEKDEISIRTIGNDKEKWLETMTKYRNGRMVTVYEKEPGFINLIKHIDGNILEQRRYCECYAKDNKNNAYIWSTINNNRIFFISEKECHIFCINLNDDKLEYLEDTNGHIDGIKEDKNFSCAVEVDNNKFYTIEMEQGYLIEVDMDTLTYIKRKIQCDNVYQVIKNFHKKRMYTSTIQENRDFSLLDFVEGIADCGDYNVHEEDQGLLI